MEIMFEDLTPEAQKRLLDAAGVSRPEDMDWDELPVAVVEFSESDYEFSSEYEEEHGYPYSGDYVSDDEDDYPGDLDDDEFYD